MGTKRGHRAVPHTADLRVEAWAPTRETCVAEAVRGTVESFAEVSGGPSRVHRSTVAADTDADLLAAVLEELVFVVDTTGAVPVGVEVTATAEGAEVCFDLAEPGRVTQVGAAPKAVSLHELRLTRRGDGWWCSVTLDV